MDSRIPKPMSAIPQKKPVEKSLFDFSTLKKFDEDMNKKKIAHIDSNNKKPLNEISNCATLGDFKFTRSKSPDVFRTSNTISLPKMRRSKSAVDISRPILKRAPTALTENVPSKRFKIAGSGISKPQISVANKKQPSELKKKAIAATIKSSTNLTTNVVRKPLIKSNSTDMPKSSAMSSKFAPLSKTVAGSSNSTAQIAKPTTKPKIPPYDFKARFHDMKERHDVLKTKAEQQKEQIASLEEQVETFESRERELLDKIEKIEQELFDATEEKDKLVDEIKTLKSQNRNLSVKNAALAADLTLTTEQFDITKKNLADLTKRHDKQTIEYEQLKEESGGLKQNYEDASTKLLLSQDQLYQINIERKVLHNMVLDLRGNIRVFARVRPPLASEEDKILCGFSFPDDASMEILSNELTAGGKKQVKHDFTFDHIFDPNTAQEDIFAQVSPLIQSAMDGYNICIFAYGQTGSGKTFTMDGHEGKLGIIPRTVKLLFDSVKTAEILGWKYTIKASFLEIYNEVLYDLLSNENKDVEIRMANAKSKMEIYVSNLTEIEVKTASKLHELMMVARSNRATAATAGNERSSRSHAVTRLEITGQHASKPETLIGMINLVDLAGSESPKTSTRMDETKNINRSLSELSNVIISLVQKNDHIPYRNSKLTHLLMPCLGGNSKTLMFVNVAPFQDCFVESVKSLRFAATVNSCKLAKAKRNKQMNQSSMF